MTPHNAEFPPGAVIFRQGDSGDAAYLIEAGSVKISRVEVHGGAEQKLAVLTAGAIFGEMALLDPAPRMATATAIDAVRCIAINGDVFRAQIQKMEPLGLNLLRALIRTQRHHAHGADLHDVAKQHFDLPKLHIEGAARFEFDTGQVIYRPGDAPNGVFIILDGAVELRQADAAAGWKHYRSLTHDEVFGEEEVTKNHPRRHEARALQVTHCIMVNPAQFNEIIANAPKFIAGLMRIYAASG